MFGCTVFYVYSAISPAIVDRFSNLLVERCWSRGGPIIIK